MAELTSRGIPLSLISPKYLHSNSTSHTWPFSAIAELIDNSYDPDVNAKHIWINKSEIKDQDCLTFMDDGKGMEYDKLHKMLSFGFSDKKSLKDHVPVGRYGNGFKSGSMRLGKDAIVFSKKAETMCVGLLSQTYLEKTLAQNVIVPIVMFTKTEDTVSATPEHAESLNDILKYSLFNTKEELMTEFSVIERLCTNSSGTRIIIWNLRRTSTGQLELDFKKQPYDFQIPTDVSESSTETNKLQPEGHMGVPESEYSLRAYCSILYLKTKMHIILQGKKVKTQFVKRTLAIALKDSYKPDCIPPLEKPVPITFGYNTKNKQHYGLMLYHKNRLIKAYERVPCQRKAKTIGAGVIGVMECNYLTPTHNKQDFEKTKEYRNTMLNVEKKLKEYWKEAHHRYKIYMNNKKPLHKIEMQPDQNWVNCDECLKWRKLPDGIDSKQIPDKWSCNMNHDPKFRSCEAEEENEDSDDEQKTYQKTHKEYERKIQEKRSKNTEQQICLGSSPSNDNLVDTQETHATFASKGNKRAHMQSIQDQDQMNAKGNMADTSSKSITSSEGSSSTTNQVIHTSVEDQRCYQDAHRSEQNQKIQKESKNPKQQSSVGSSSSNNNSVNTQDTHDTSTSKGNKRAHMQSTKTPNKKKAKSNMPDNPLEYTSPAEGDFTPTIQTDNTSSQDQQPVVFLQAMDTIKQLKDKVEALEKDKSTLLSFCSRLNNDLEVLEAEREKFKIEAEDPLIQTDFPVSCHEEGAAASVDSFTQKYSVILRELRQKVAYLLTTFNDPLDPWQVNYNGGSLSG